MQTPDQTSVSTIHVQLLVAPGCPHCASVLEGLGTLVKEGTVARLEVVNISAQPEVARVANVRSVPWMRIGSFELSGLHTLGELRHWVKLAGQEDGMTYYLADLLATGRRHQVTERVRQDPSLLSRLVDLLGDSETGLSVRIGVMATLEEFQESDLLGDLVDQLVPLTRNTESRIRADASHALSLTGVTSVIDVLRPLTEDADPEVRETAIDAIESLEAR